MSLCNSYLSYGIEDWAGGTPIKNPLNNIKHPAIIFNSDNNHSVGDSFWPSNRFGPVVSTGPSSNGDDNYLRIIDAQYYIYPDQSITFSGNIFGGVLPGVTYYITDFYWENHANADAYIQISTSIGGDPVTLSTVTAPANGAMTYRTGGGFPDIPYIENNGYSNFQLVQDIGLIDGKRTAGRGRTLALADTNTFQTATLTFIPKNYKCMTVNYCIEHNSKIRQGAMRISNINNTYMWDEEYTETGDVGVEFKANTSTGDIEYTSVTAGDVAMLTYSLDYFTE
jgi:hypothetical protein